MGAGATRAVATPAAPAGLRAEAARELRAALGHEARAALAEGLLLRAGVGPGGRDVGAGAFWWRRRRPFDCWHLAATQEHAP